MHRSSEAFVSTAFQRKPWLQWFVVIAVPMIYFLVVKLATLPALLDTLAPQEEDRTGSATARGVLLGMVEDFITTALLAVTLVLADLATLLCRRWMVWSGADEHFHTSMILRGIGHVVRFVLVLTLVAITLTPFTLDMMLVRVQKTRFATGAHPSGSDSDAVALFSVALVSLAFTVLVVWRMNLVHWWPKHEQERPSETVSTLSFSTPTYMDIRFEPLKITPNDVNDVEEGKAVEQVRAINNSRHTTIVSAPCELYGDDEHSVAPRTLLGPWLRIVFFTCAGFGALLLLVSLTCTAAHHARPLVAGIALNASLNELVRGLFQTHLVPSIVG